MDSYTSSNVAEILWDPAEPDEHGPEPLRDEDPRERMAELGDAGFIQFTVDESAGLVRVYDLAWIG